jgi:sortase A
VPILPSVQFALQKNSPPPTLAADNLPPDQFPKDNRLVIPSIRLDQVILSGQNETTVDKGVWHKPESTTPDRVGNSVIVGHRFTYSPQIKDPFYHLDKVEIGDDVYAYWEGQRIRYKITEKKVVAETTIEIESQSLGDRLTLYTCTPLWTAENRLVLIGSRVNEGEAL